MREIKPGVLSKIMTLTERDPSTTKDETLAKLMQSAREIQDSLLQYANHKPLKKALLQNLPNREEKSKAMKNLIQQIMEFK